MKSENRIISLTSFFILSTDLAMAPSLPSSSPTRHFSATFSSSNIPLSVATKSGLELVKFEIDIQVLYQYM